MTNFAQNRNRRFVQNHWRGENRLSVSPATLLFVLIGLAFAESTTALAQQPRVIRQKQITGTIVSLKPGEITIEQKNGSTETYKIQDKDDRAISIGGTPVRIPAQINVSGTIPAKLAERGMIVRFIDKTNVYGKHEGELQTVTVLPADSTQELKVDFLERPEGRDQGKVEIVGRVVNVLGSKLQLQVPKAKWAKKERITFNIGEDSVLEIADDHLKRVVPNDIARRVNVLEFDNGEFAANLIEVFLAGERTEVTTSYHEKLEQEFSLLSDEPGSPRELRSEHFVLYTDISDRSGQILLAKLETMYGLVSGYYSARPNSVIECYVVQDLRKWPRGRLNPVGAAKIAQRAGVTLTLTNGRNTKATVYSCEKHSVVQHEAVHAFCALTFGKLGPVWYAEGMAEMGQYWKPGEVAVNIDSVVIDYLANAKPKKMADIVAAGQITGDSWQAYAWRWALCHLLASNPNYSRRFKKLGLNMMTGKPDSFEAAFGRVAPQISYEYDLFVKHFDNGYRADLCAWDWKTRCSNLSSDGRVKHTVKAQRGWQATKLLVREGVSYDVVAKGKWKVNNDGEVTADGNPNGVGKLIGMVFYGDHQQTEPFELGENATFVGPLEGQLYVRCRDSLTELSDNDGKIEMHIRRTPKAESD